MTREELAKNVGGFIVRCATRILGTGRDQYAGVKDEVQQFEGMPLIDLLEYAQEEMEDTGAYAYMLWERLERLRPVIERLAQEERP